MKPAFCGWPRLKMVYEDGFWWIGNSILALSRCRCGMWTTVLNAYEHLEEHIEGCVSAQLETVLQFAEDNGILEPFEVEEERG